MEKDSGTALHILTVDGGMSNSDVCMQVNTSCGFWLSGNYADFWQQLQADIVGIDVDRPLMRETTALGAAIAAGFAVGVWRNVKELAMVNREGRSTFSPRTDVATRSRRFELWTRAVKKAEGWIGDDEKTD